MNPVYSALIDSLQRERLVALCTVIEGPGVGLKLAVWPGGSFEGDLGCEEVNRAGLDQSAQLLEQQKTQRLSLDLGGQTAELFIEVFTPPPRMILVGAVHVAQYLVTFAKALGFHTVVVDPRSVFATPERFRDADRLLAEWPHEALSPEDFNEATYVVALSHDEKLDNPVLKLALESRCRYIGALGSRKTHARRSASLLEMGVTEAQLTRIHSPIGLDLGGRRPEEIAIAILAEIVAVRNGKDPRGRSGPSNRSGRPA